MEKKLQEGSQLQETTLGQDLSALVRHWLRGRRGLLVIGGALALAGLGFGWSWLVALGLGPLLITVLPCLVMCGLGICMACRNGGSSSSGTGDETKAAKGTQNSDD